MIRKKTILDIHHVAYQPHAAHRHDVEVLSFAELRKRVPESLLRRSERLGFWLLIGVHTGHCVHQIDFAKYPLKAGDWVVLAPGQVQQYDIESDWDGVMVVFKPPLLQPLAQFFIGTGGFDWTTPALMGWSQPVVPLDEPTHHTCMGLVAQMQDDTRQFSAASGVAHVLGLQLNALLWRLAYGQRQLEQVVGQQVSGPLRAYFLRFQQCVEQRFTQAHQVADYVGDLSCTERTLNRACQKMAGCSAKIIIARRVVLEAQRLLVHTELAVSSIGHRLGFDEPTHFGKFFRQGAGCSPCEFRRRHSGRSHNHVFVADDAFEFSNR